MKLESVSIKRTEGLNEVWVQNLIADDPTILGIGDIILKDKERIQPNAGRLDLLLQDPETLKRYEVEIQLGSVDESHIIRTIEYWDIERKRYPQYEHCAVIVAEEITSRFLNVIQLFNGSIPLIAIKMTAYKVGDEYALTFVKVLDEMSYGLIDEDEAVAEPTDRNYWESKRASKKSVSATDALLKIVNQVEPKAVLKYNKHYIGLEVNGSAMNFVSFVPRKSTVIMNFRILQSQEIDDIIEENGFDKLSYDTQFRYYRIRLDTTLDEKQISAIHQLCKKAYDAYGRNS